VVSGATPVKVVAADDRALREVRVYLDGWLSLTSTGSVDRRLKSRALGDGRHVIMAEAVDQAGNVDVDVPEFVIRNGAAAEAREQGLTPGAISRRQRYAAVNSLKAASARSADAISDEMRTR
jgi:hypothetical protein